MRNIKLAATAIPAALLAITCGGQNQGAETYPEPPEEQPAEAETETETEGETAQTLEPAQIDVSSWRSWQPVTKERILSAAHGDLWAEIYVPQAYANDYLAGTTPVPEGMQIVMAHYTTQDAPEPESLALMIKMGEDYDPEHQSWYYGVYAPSGDRALVQGTVQACIDCHQQASANYLFRNLQ